MTTFTMMVGLVGSGKSFQAKKLAEQTNATIIESDAYRKGLYGNENIQGDNNKLFEIIHRDIYNTLETGRNVVFDATNISYKHRMAALQQISRLKDVEKVCYLIATDIETCKERNKNRERVVPEYVLDRMWKTFTCPAYYEGFDKIEILFDYNKNKYDIDKYFKEIDSFSQDNPHHALSLGGHTQKVMDFIYQNQIETDANTFKRLWCAAMLHDNGKRYTKTFKDAKGNSSEVGHYYNHEGVGSYEALFYLKELGFEVNEILWICGLIQNHMRPYNLQTDKAKEKLLKLVGKEMYDQLIILNEADSQAH